MEGLPSQTGTPSLSTSYADSVRVFQWFLQALSDKDCRVIRLDQIDLNEMLGEYGRIKIWGDQSNAEFPESEPGSLDDKLGKDNELKSLAQAILMRLTAILRQATSIASKKYDPKLEFDQDSVSSVSTDTDSQLDNDGKHSDHRIPKICQLVKQMAEQIRSLYDLSSLLRRPWIVDKSIRPADSRSSLARVGDLGLATQESRNIDAMGPHQQFRERVTGQSRDPYAVDAYESYPPIAAAAHRYEQQARHSAISFPNLPCMQQNIITSHTWRAQTHAPTYHDMPSPRTQRNEEFVDPSYQVTFAGYQQQLDDRRQRTASFGQYRQRHHPGARDPPSSVEAERSGIRYAATSITDFDNQFSRTADTNASSPNIQQGERLPSQGDSPEIDRRVN